jgi:hypothetical protein
MKKSHTVLRLEALFKNDPNPRWRNDHDHEYFRPSSAGRRTCQLSAVATAFLIENLCGRNAKTATFILIEPEGDIRLWGHAIMQDWAQAIKCALDEGSYIYNARTKRCSRPVWSPTVEERKFSNMTFESVRLLADAKTYNEKLPKVNSRLFKED